MWLVYTYFEFFNDSQFRYDAYSLNEHLKARENMLLFSGSFTKFHLLAQGAALLVIKCVQLINDQLATII